MPRESRDALFMLAVIAWTIGPLLAYLPWGVILLGALLLLGKAQQILKARPLPGRYLMGLLLLLCISATWFSHKTLLGRDAGVSLIVMLLCLKTLELKAKRDAWVVFFLAFFTMLTNFFFSQTLVTAVTMLIASWGWMTALVLAHRPVGRPAIASVALAAGKMCLLGAPIMLALFMLFPRLAPLWGKPGDGISKSGLSGQMQVGQIAQLALDDSVALRVRWLESDSSSEAGGSSSRKMPPRGGLYFRGPVLTVFDGQRWLASPRTYSRRPPATVSVQGPSWGYEVTLEPNRENWLLVLDGTVKAPTVPGYATQLNQDMQWTLDRPVYQALAYRAQSHTLYRYDYASQPTRLWEALALPVGANPRTLQWAMDIRRNPQYQNAETRELVNFALGHLSKGGYIYTLNPGTSGIHAADEFWFDRKQGFCEHFASSFVILMRALDIPARVVTGYQGGELNPLDGLWTVRQSDAHAWAEVWDSREGWIRVDPTAAVAPARFEILQRLQVQPGPIGAAISGALGSMPMQWLSGWRSAWEALNSRWNHYVLNYTQGRQFDLLRSLGMSSPSWQDLLQVLGVLALGTALVGIAVIRLSKQKADPWVQLLNQFRDKLNQRGLTCLPSHTPRELSKMMHKRWGESASNGSQWLLSYENARYAPNPEPAMFVQLQKSFANLQWPDSQT
jgi:protein-glutamine gamma-glutamyltransferase